MNQQGVAVKSSSQVYLEAYTSILLVNKEHLETFYDKEIIITNHNMVETQAEEILHGADKNKTYPYLSSAIPLGASFTTTHVNIILHACSSGIPICMIHNVLIMMGSLMFSTDMCQKLDSFYDHIHENMGLGLHMLASPDIKVKEQSEENLAWRGGNKREDRPPQYMFIPQAISQLLEVESFHAKSILSPRMSLPIALSCIGCDAGSENTQQHIMCGTLEQLGKQHSESFGEPLHSIVIVWKRLHHLEAVYVEEYAVCRETWR
ncbi:Diphthine synthase [Pisolithus marmoratus]|nr:Diphthine synthase [Pisolithus marmoratus]